MLTDRLIRAAAEMDAAVREARAAMNAARQLPAARTALRAAVRVMAALSPDTPAPTRVKVLESVWRSIEEAADAGMECSEISWTVNPGAVRFPPAVEVPRAVRAYRNSRPERRAQLIRARAALHRWLASEF